MLWTTDEEVGSTTSRALIEAEATKSEAVLVFEPSLPGGALKTSRKGVGQFEMIARGVSAHAGLDPGKGVSAVRELARQIIAIDDLQDPAHGVTVTVGVDSRRDARERGPRRGPRHHRRARQHARRCRALRSARCKSLQPQIAGARLEVTGGFDRPPLERSAAVDQAVRDRAKAVAAEIGSRWRRAAPAAAPTATSPRRSACRRSTASAPSATARTRCTSTSRSTRWCRGPRLIAGSVEPAC